MTMNPLPPQAYTKETLVQAYAWLQNQSESVKEIATTPDVLVSLYLKAKLQGQDFFERPSIQNFKNELKSLAGMIGEFEVLEPSSMAPTSQATPSATSATSYQGSPSPAPTAATIPSTASLNVGSTTTDASGNQSYRFRSQDLKAQQQALTAQSLKAPSNSNTELDARSEAMIQEVKEQFNLSSDEEALRLLVATGFHQLKALIK